MQTTMFTAHAFGWEIQAASARVSTSSRRPWLAMHKQNELTLLRYDRKDSALSFDTTRRGLITQ